MVSRGSPKVLSPATVSREPVKSSPMTPVMVTMPGAHRNEVTRSHAQVSVATNTAIFYARKKGIR